MKIDAIFLYYSTQIRSSDLCRKPWFSFSWKTCLWILTSDKAFTSDVFLKILLCFYWQNVAWSSISGLNRPKLLKKIVFTIWQHKLLDKDFSAIGIEVRIFKSSSLFPADWKCRFFQKKIDFYRNDSSSCSNLTQSWFDLPLIADNSVNQEPKKRNNLLKSHDVSNICSF